MLPSHWDSMPKNNNGLEGKFHCVSLNKSSNEFQDISNKFCGSSGGHITTGNIIDIQRIQNPQLFRTYTAKKESMEKTAGKNSINELVVFHGTNPNSVLEINESGFNRSFAGVNGKRNIRLEILCILLPFIILMQSPRIWQPSTSIFISYDKGE